MPFMPAGLSKAFFALVLFLGASWNAAAEPFDIARLKTIPLLDVIHLATARFQVIGVADGANREARLVEIAALDPKVRTLVWLVLLDTRLSEPSDVPTSYIGTGFFMPEMMQALDDAAMADLAALLRRAALDPKPLIAGLDFDPTRPETYRKVEPGAAFGDKAAFEALLLAWVHATPSVAAWCDTARATLSDDDRFSALDAALRRIPGFYLEETMARWPEPYRLIELVSIYEGELFNGGIEQYISNSSGDLAPTTASALRAIGLPSHAALLEQAMSVLSQPYPTDRTRRLQALGLPSVAPGPLEQKLDDLSSEAAGPIVPALVAFAKREDLLPR